MRMMAAAAGRRRPGRRLNGALLASLLAHALLLSLTFGDGLGLPGLALPWQARRAEVPALRVVLITPPAPPVAGPAPAEAAVSGLPAEHATPAEAPRAEGAAAPAAAPADPPPAVKTLAPPEALAGLAPAPLGGPAWLNTDRTAAWAAPAASALPSTVVAAFAAASSPAVEALRSAGEALRPRDERAARDRTAELAQLDAARQDLKPAAIAAFGAASTPALERVGRAGDALRVTADRERTAELAQLDVAREAAQQRARQLEAARLDALRQEAARAEAARQEAARAEALRLEAARAEAARQESLRADAARQDAARAEAERQAVARQEAARAEAERAEAARQAAARLEAGRQEAGRAEAARQDAARLAAGRLDAARLAAAQAQAEAEQREARLRAIGRQLDEEAARRDAERQRPDWTPARRGRLFGRTDPNAELVLYAEAWARKIQLNGAAELLRDAARQPHTDPIITVAVRSNGSVESISFVRSSGVPALDEAITRVVRSQENYPAFPPALLRDYDVVEIRRSWHFDMAIRLY